MPRPDAGKCALDGASPRGAEPDACGGARSARRRCAAFEGECRALPRHRQKAQEVSAPLRRELRARQLRQRGHLRQIPFRDTARDRHRLRRAFGAVGLSRRTGRFRRTLHRDLAVGPQSRSSLSRRSCAIGRRSHGCARQRHRVAACRDLRARHSASRLAGAKRRRDEVVDMLARRDPAARGALGGGRRSPQGASAAPR